MGRENNHSMYTFYFDESQKSDALSVKNHNLNFDNTNDLYSFIGVFCGYPTEYIVYICEKMKLFDDAQKKNFNLTPEQELKSTTIKKNNFKYGLASLKRKSIAFYADFFHLLSDIRPILVISFTNKFEVFLRIIIQNINVGEERENNFFYTLSKFFSLYGHGGFFDEVNKHPRKAVFNLSQRLKDMVIRDFGIERFRSRNMAYLDVISILNQASFSISPIEHTRYPFGVLPDALTLLLDEIDIFPGDVDLVIDGEDGQYPRFKGRFRSINYADSQKNPMIRISDHLAGLISRMCYAIKNDPSRRECDIDADVHEKNRLRLMSPQWFDIKEPTFNLYKLVHEVIVHNNQHYWTIITLCYRDDIFTFISLLCYFSQFSSYDEFIKTDASKHSRYFEQYTCLSMVNMLEMPNNPAHTLSVYDLIRFS